MSMSRGATTIKDGKLVYSMWLILHRDGSARMTRAQSATNAHERAMKLTVEVPEALFRTPTLEGKIIVGDDMNREVLLAEVETNAARLLQENMGLSLNLTVSTQEAGK